MLRRISTTAAAIAATSGAAVASPYFTNATEYNLFTFGSTSIINTSVGGRIASGGSISLTNISVGAQLTNSNGSRDDVITAGALQMTYGSVANGNIRHAGAAALTGVGLPNGSAYQASSPLSFTDARNSIIDFSNSLANLDVTGSTSVAWGGVTLTGSSADLNVFSVSSADLFNANSFTINAPTSSTVLINVGGATNRMQNFGFNLVGATKSNILFNFFETTTLNLSGIGVEGSILAPLAAVGFSNGALNGSLIAESFRGSGSFNNQPFTGSLTSVPAPGAASLAMLGLAVAGRRRR